MIYLISYWFDVNQMASQTLEVIDDYYELSIVTYSWPCNLLICDSFTGAGMFIPLPDVRCNVRCSSYSTLSKHFRQPIDFIVPLLVLIL